MQLFCRAAMHVNQNRPYIQTTVRRYKNEISFHDFFNKSKSIHFQDTAWHKISNPVISHQIQEKL